METKTLEVVGFHAAVTCRWATPTLFLERPLWFAAWDFPWTCTYRDPPQPLETTNACGLCTNWEPKADADARR
jgi:hypothetical protein